MIAVVVIKTFWFCLFLCFCPSPEFDSMQPKVCSDTVTVSAILPRHALRLMKDLLSAIGCQNNASCLSTEIYATIDDQMSLKDL